jgi:DNA-binding HxlR family transcriptional regulator
MDLAGWLGRGVDPLAELEDLCGHRWEGHVLIQLAAAPAPLRRAELAVAIRQHSGGRPDDAQLNRTLKQLRTKRLIRAVTIDGNRQHELTDRGRQQARLLEALLPVLARWLETNQAGARPDHDT